MKFGRTLSAEMVQEWQGAYVDYNHLKKLLKDIMKQNSGFLKRKLTKAVSQITGRPTKKNMNEEAAESPINTQSGPGTCFRTMFLGSSEEGRELEGEFFKKIDNEFDKVVSFYSEKIKELRFRAEELSKQMDLLLALRAKVESGNKVEEIEQTSNEGHTTEKGNTDDSNNIRDFRPVSSEIMINVDPETPRSTLRKVIIRSSKSEPSFSMEELRKTEKKLQRAMVEFYQQLQLLKKYRALNLLALSKIMKKYDKITSRKTSNSYLEIVDKSCIGSCDEVDALIQKVETTFVKHFTKGNHREGMKCLRPHERKERHRTTFFLGLFSGCSIALVAGIVVSIHARNLLNHEGHEQYMSTIYPLYSLFIYIVLHMLLYGANTYFWRRYRVNYPFIFGFKPGTELGFREIFLLASGLTVLAFSAVLANLDIEMNPDTQSFQTLTELVPLGLVIVVLLVTICPFNILYRSSRFFLVRCAWRCICAPLYMVTFSDFFLADQLTSQVQALRSLQFYICYYGWGDFRRRSNTCLQSNIYENFYIAIAIIPFFARVLQCLRRLIEEKNLSQGLNGLKYFSTVVALIMRTMYSLRRGQSWRIMAASASGITTIYNTYWDIAVDWELLKKNSKNKWLRDNLLISSKAVYFVAIAVNVLLRLVWMQLILDFNETPFLHRNSMIVVVACLEIVRRGVWNFFRVENEHFHNVGKFRASKSVNLPFYHQDEKSVTITNKEK